MELRQVAELKTVREHPLLYEFFHSPPILWKPPQFYLGGFSW